jgi:hypothetical protein
LQIQNKANINCNVVAVVRGLLHKYKLTNNDLLLRSAVRYRFKGGQKMTCGPRSAIDLEIEK